MLLLNNLNEAGFKKLKEDREVLLKEINHLQSILSQFDLAYPFLSSIFEPEVKIKYDKSKDSYSGYFKLKHPNFDKPIFESFRLGDSNRYKGIEDPQLIIDGKMRARKKIQKLFPEMFEDAGQ
jgi:hypothetical protein